MGSTAWSNVVTYANWTGTYIDFTYNATGLGLISKIGITKTALRNANYDVAATLPAWISATYSALSGYMADQTGTTNDPKLVVTYTIPTNRVMNII
jgi:hypothetical protein